VKAKCHFFFFFLLQNQRTGGQNSRKGEMAGKGGRS
jgi:hypothetical protein